MSSRQRVRHDRCVREIVKLELDLYGQGLSTSIQEDCQHEPSTFVAYFAQPDAQGRRGRHFTACCRCRKVLIQQ